MRAQLTNLVQQLGGDRVQLPDRDTEVVTKAITAGFFAHAARLEADGGNRYRTVRGNQELFIHPSSVLFRASPKWVVYHSIIYLERYYMSNVTAINPAWLVELAPHFFQLGNTRRNL